MTNTPVPEFSRPFPVVDLHEEATRRIEASETECAAVARRLDVEAVAGFAADLTLVREMGAIVRLTGRFRAEITQTCVVTLDPVGTHVEIEVNRRYAPPEVVADMEAETKSEEEEVPYEDEDPPDLIENGVIDLGEAVTELLSLEIDPFPRAEGAEFPGFASGPGGEDRKESPFAVLEGLVKKPK